MSYNLVYGKDELLKDWASFYLFGHDGGFDEKDVTIGLEYNGKLIAATIYNNYRPNLSIEMSIATVDKRWCTRYYLNKIFAYPFAQLGLERVQITTSVNNEGVNKLVKRLGFVKEGTHRRAMHDGSDAYSWSMLKHECRWI